MKKRYRLSLDIPQALWELLHERAKSEQRSITEIIRRQFEIRAYEAPPLIGPDYSSQILTNGLMPGRMIEEALLRAKEAQDATR